jgi:hypothetical protein
VSATSSDDDNAEDQNQVTASTMMGALDVLSAETHHHKNASTNAGNGNGIRFEDGPPQIHVFEKDYHDDGGRLPLWWLEEVPHYTAENDRIDYTVDVAYFPPSYSNQQKSEEDDDDDDEGGDDEMVGEEDNCVENDEEEKEQRQEESIVEEEKQPQQQQQEQETEERKNDEEQEVEEGLVAEF